jgi:hypothetical protein
MQNAADAAALAAAAQLDRRSDARARAEDVARHAASQANTVALGAATLEVAAVDFFSSLGAAPVHATNDQNAAFVRVTLAPRAMNVMFQPVLDLLLAVAAGAPPIMQAAAIAAPEPFVCNAPTMMVCDISALQFGDIMSPTQAGRELFLRERVTGIETVSFRMLCPPGNASDPACAVAEAVSFGAAPDPDQCGGPVVRAVSATAAEIDQAFNPRFDGPDPAPLVIQYLPHQAIVGIPSVTGAWGTGSWSPETYWANNHPPTEPFPPALAGATRYQVYLYETGSTFARSGASTLYPSPAPADLPEGHVLVDPGGAHPPISGAPATAPFPDPRRRVVRAAVVNCSGTDLSQSLPTLSRFIDLFLVSRSSNSIVTAEIVGPVSATSPSDLHANVRLVQ